MSFSPATDSYTRLGNYSSPNTSSCRYLKVTEGQLVTDTNQAYMWVGSSFNSSTIFTIDDNGVMHLIGTYINLNRVDQTSAEFNVSNFQKSQSFMIAKSQFQVNFNDAFPTLTNNRNWTFNAQYGQLTIANGGNAGLSESYTYARFNMNNSNILDFNGISFPGAIFPNITFAPRCLEPRTYLNFKPAYVFVADPYWPIFTLYEQGRYKVF